MVYEFVDEQQASLVLWEGVGSKGESIPPPLLLDPPVYVVAEVCYV